MDRISPIQSPLDTEGAVDPAAREAINELINLCADGIEGHAKSADLVENGVARSLFELWSRQRAEFLAALQNVAVRFGAAEDDPGTRTGTLHRAWMTLANAVTGDDEYVIGAAANGEEAAIEAYETALATDLPDYARTVVHNQYEQIKDIHARLTNWEDV